MERIISGTEIELGLTKAKQYPKPFDESHYKYLVQKLITTAAAYPFLPAVYTEDITTNALTVWIGAYKFYQDPRGHAEIATCETETLDDAVIYEEAAKRLARLIAALAVYQKEFKDIKAKSLTSDEFTLRNNFFVIANNMDYHTTLDNRLNVWGYHENLSKVGPNKEQTEILPFLVTRQIFAGSGAILPKQAEKIIGARFLISPRASTVICRGDRLCLSDVLAVFSAGRDQEDKVHITIGDTNVSERQTKLKIGTTKLVHQLFLEGWHPPEWLCELPKDELACASCNISKLANYSNFQDWTVKLGGRTVSAIEIQRIYLDGAKKYFGNLKDKDTIWTLDT